GEVVSHPGYLPPRDGWLGGEQVIGQGLDRLADLQQADADSVEDQPVRQVTAFQVGANRVDRSLDVGQPLTVPVGHSTIRSDSTRSRTPGLRSAAGIRSTRLPRMPSRSASRRPSPNRLSPGGKSASRSTSLPGWSSPRATLPNTRKLLTPCAAA